jgi:hypothetical protein
LVRHAETVQPLATGQGIPRAQWPRFFEHISREYGGEQTTLELATPESGGAVVPSYQRFRSIAADEDYVQNRIAIVLENASGDPTMHTLSKATQVRLADALRSPLVTLTMATMSGTVAVLHFAHAPSPNQ